TRRLPAANSANRLSWIPHDRSPPRQTLHTPSAFPLPAKCQSLQELTPQKPRSSEKLAKRTVPQPQQPPWSQARQPLPVIPGTKAQSQPSHSAPQSTPANDQRPTKPAQVPQQLSFHSLCSRSRPQLRRLLVLAQAPPNSQPELPQSPTPVHRGLAPRSCP